MALIGDARSDRKNGPVETGLTGPAATALLILSQEDFRLGVHIRALLKGLHVVFPVSGFSWPSFLFLGLQLAN